jgi:hypothetical protein
VKYTEHIYVLGEKRWLRSFATQTKEGKKEEEDNIYYLLYFPRYTGMTQALFSHFPHHNSAK